MHISSKGRKRKSAMSSIFAGFDSTRNSSRKVVAVLCFTLTSALVSGLFAYTDSYSISVWDTETNVGPASMVLMGHDVSSLADEINSLPGGVEAAPLVKAWARVFGFYQDPVSLPNATDEIDVGPGEIPPAEVQAVYLDNQFQQLFPNIFSLRKGRFPANSSEIALVDWLASIYSVDIGKTIRYYRNDPLTISDHVLVGIFSHEETDNSNMWHYVRGDVIVVPELIGDKGLSDYLYVKLDESKLSPMNARSALEYLSAVEDTIRRMDPNYNEQGYTRSFHLEDMHAQGVIEYLDWLSDARTRQIGRIGGYFLLVIPLTFLGVRHNLRSRQRELDLLSARGASTWYMFRRIVGELVLLSTLSVAIGFLLGIQVSRLALAATGFFLFDWSDSVAKPLLVATDALQVVIIVGFILPLASLFVYLNVTSVRRRAERESGRFARIVKGLGSVWWDMTLVLTSIIVLAAVYEVGESFLHQPFMPFVLVMTPFAFYAGLSSLVNKGLHRGMYVASRMLLRRSDKYSLTIGVRRIGRRASLAGPVIMLVVLSLSLATSNAITSSSLPFTELNNVRFDLGGDMVFQLNSNAINVWDELIENITDLEHVEASALVTVQVLYLSTGIENAVDFAAIEPSDFERVGYDSYGLGLEQSSLGSSLAELGANPSGAIITQEISTRFGVSVGDSLRAFQAQGTESDVLTFTVIAIVDEIPVSLAAGYSYGSNSGGGVSWRGGTSRVWVNRDYLLEFINVTSVTSNFLCMRLSAGSNGSSIVNQILYEGGGTAIMPGGIAIASVEVEKMTSHESYKMDRSMDTGMTVLAFACIIPAFALYVIERAESRQRESLLLKSTGAGRKTIISIELAELFSLFLLSLVFLLATLPLFMANSVLLGVHDYGIAGSALQAPFQVVVPWMAVIIIVTLYVLLTVVFVLVSIMDALRSDVLVVRMKVREENASFGGSN